MLALLIISQVTVLCLNLNKKITGGADADYTRDIEMKVPSE